MSVQPLSANSWNTVRLEDILDVASGQVDPREPLFQDLLHVGGDNIEGGTGQLIGVLPTRELNLISGKYEFTAEDVLYSKIRPALNKVALPDFAGICSADIYPLRPRPGVLERRYLAHLLRGGDFLAYAMKHSSRTNIPKINREALLSYEADLPPLTDQRRIADILDKADAIRRKRKEAIALTEELLRSTFLEMFGDPVTNPKGWPLKEIGRVIQRFEAGTSVSGEPRQRDTDGFGVLKISAVTSGVFRPEEHKAVERTSVPPVPIFPRRGDLLFSRANTRELVAATCLVEADEPHLFLPDKLWRVVVSNSVTKEYLRYLLGHPGFRTELTKRATGTSGSMLNVSMGKVSALEAPIPPKAHQDRFSMLVWHIYKLRNKLTSGHLESESLFSSLLHRAFRGELTAPTAKSAASTPKQLSLLE